MYSCCAVSAQYIYSVDIREFIKIKTYCYIMISKLLICQLQKNILDPNLCLHRKIFEENIFLLGHSFHLIFFFFFFFH